MKNAITMMVVGLMFGGIAASLKASEANVCAKDIETFCKDVQPGEGRMASCLSKHSKELTPECQAYRKDLRKALTGIPRVCFDEAEVLCADVLAAGKGGLKTCLKSHKAELSPVCQDRLAKAKKKNGKSKQG